MDRTENPERQLAVLEYTNRVSGLRRPPSEEKLKPYLLMQQGNPGAAEEAARIMERAAEMNWSADALRGAQYLFAGMAALAVRFAVEGGLEAETAYNARDLYIRRMDGCRTPEEVTALLREMFGFFTGRMAALPRERILSRDIALCTDYIDAHLYRPLRITELAELTKRTPGYLSTLFRKETGMTFTEYLMTRRTETAMNMLRYSDYGAAEISEMLGFSSQSYFIRCFRKLTGKTPAEYRRERRETEEGPAEKLIKEETREGGERSHD